MDVSPWKNTSAAFKAQIIGKLLGDGCITIQQGRKPRFQFIHTSADFAWSNYCFHQLKKEIPLNPPKFRKIFDNRLVKGFSTSHYTQSRTSTVICYLRKQWYPNNRKEIPFSLLYTYFTRQSLAWWYMDDGHLKIVNGIPTKIILSTESFSKQENKHLIAFLEQKYGLVFKTDKQNRIILYDQFQIRYFLFLINPYMQTCMYRKTITTFYLPNVQNHKRTTLYLPNSIPLKHPTKEINQTLQHLDQIIFAYKQNCFYDVYKQKVSLLQQNTKPYQIVIHCTNLKRLLFLKEATGLNFSKITELAFTI